MTSPKTIRDQIISILVDVEEQKFEYYNTGADCDVKAYGALWQCQTYTPEKKHKITSVKLSMLKEGYPGTVTVSIRATSEGKPVGEDLCVGTTDGNTLTNSPFGEWREIIFTSQAILEVGVQYAIVIRALDGDDSNNVGLRNDNTSPTYPRGTNVCTLDSGETWTIYTSRDLMFEEWGKIVTPKFFKGQPPRSRFPGFPCGWVEWAGGEMLPPVGSRAQILDRFYIVVVEKHIDAEKAEDSIMEFVDSVEAALDDSPTIENLVAYSWVSNREKEKQFDGDYSLVAARLTLSTRRNE